MAHGVLLAGKIPLLRIYLNAKFPPIMPLRPPAGAPNVLIVLIDLNGYAMAQFGKCHKAPVWETSPVGPFEQWPAGSDFQYFYGFIDGEANQWYPSLSEGTRRLKSEEISFSGKDVVHPRIPTPVVLDCLHG